jgi:hypothetical protein
MRAKEFLIENDINYDVEEKVQQVDFLDIVHRLAKQKYPDENFENTGDRVHIPEKNIDMYGGDGFTVMGFTYSNDTGDEVGVLINDAFTGPHKGILMPAIKLATEKCLRLVPGSTPTLWVDSDESAGAWEHIAKRLGYKFEILDY